jgi:Kef-type K+ transport system membrane component KefB
LCSQAIADTPSFIFLWVGDGVGLEQGRQCLKKVYNQAFFFFFFFFFLHIGLAFCLKKVFKEGVWPCFWAVDAFICSSVIFKYSSVVYACFGDEVPSAI